MWFTSEYVFRRCEIFSSWRISKVHSWNFHWNIFIISSGQNSPVEERWWLLPGCCHLVVCRTGHVFLSPATKICENTLFCHQLILFFDRQRQRPRRRNLNCVPIWIVFQFEFCSKLLYIFFQNLSEISSASGKNRLFSRNVLCHDVVYFANPLFPKTWKFAEKILIFNLNIVFTYIFRKFTKS